jgi:hypothetical protein
MAIYYFHIQDGADSIQDKFGVDLPDLRAARTEATILAGELLRDRPDAFWGARAWTMCVEDENALMLFSIHVAAIAAPAMTQRLWAVHRP